jgi:hypothetical protein
MASKTFGATLEIFVTSAYIKIGKLIEIEPPTLMAVSPQDSTHHESASGIKEFIVSGLQEWTDCTGKFLTVPSDAGQDGLRAAIGTIVKFRVKCAGRVSPTDDILFNAHVISVVNDTHPVEGRDVQSFTLKPTGVAPAS